MSLPLSADAIRKIPAYPAASSRHMQPRHHLRVGVRSKTSGTIPAVFDVGSLSEQELL